MSVHRLRGRSELASEATIDASAEVALGLLQFVLGTLPLGAIGRCVWFGAESVVGVGDGVIEAIGLDALGRLLPGASRARLIGRRAECGQHVWARVLQRVAQVLAAANRQLGVELGGPLTEPPDFGFPSRAIGKIESQRALALGRRDRLAFGEIETLAL